MEILYNSKGIENYLDVNIGGISEREHLGVEYKIKMIQENEIPYLIKPVSMEMDGKIWLKYNTNTVYVLERMFSYMRPDGSLLKIILGQICHLICEMEKFFLSPDELVIEPAYMFYDGQTRELKLLYIPGYEKNVGEQLKNFLEFVMKIFDHRDREGMTFMYKVYDLISTQGFSLNDITTCLSWCDGGMAYGEKPEVLDMHEDDVSDKKTMYIPVEQKKKEFTWHEPVFVINAIFILLFVAKYFAFGKHEIDIIVGIILLLAMIVHGLFYVGKDEDEVIEDEIAEDMETLKKDKIQDFDIGQKTKIYDVRNSIFEAGEIKKLVPLTNGALEAIHLDFQDTAVVVGRGKKDSNYRLPTTQISRVHACIYKNANGVFVEDRASTNGTFVNSNRITAYEKVKINRGDIISFANEEFFAS